MFNIRNCDSLYMKKKDFLQFIGRKLTYMYTSAEVAYKNKETNFASDGSNNFFEKKITQRGVTSNNI